ncbi:D-malate degradation protein R [Legionella massiliensis]|uniref:D-malate degradation protein R n=1 Tax=Legionella massiliensis TaxID=1034943 RepID=A0A078KXM8_9GAMM|nr:LysR family transcriptional regulator [Legionella massiliensis]CDZ76483.1 D-malate degradation protein R [Legionella massiliensis]CEE12221.1 HTH-type transcriptional regulator DmlR [Legionella massiliensis]
MDKLANIEAFVTVGKTGSFAAAAKKLNLANSVVSKRIKDLEQFLGAQLLIRTTRKVALTETGRSYFDYVQKFLDDLDEVENSLRYKTDKPIGTIKLAAPLSFGMHFLGAAIASYLAKHPEVTIKTYLSDRYVDLMEEGYDLAIRSGSLNDSTLIAKKLLSCRRVVCASPQYFAKHGKPNSPEALKEHICLSYLNLAEGKSWPFMIDKRKVWQPVSGNFFSDNGDLLHQAALSGCGITLLPTFIVGKSIDAGLLEIVLEEFEEDDFSVYAVYQYTRHLPVKIRTLITHLAEYYDFAPLS